MSLRTQIFGPVSASVVLDGSGNGTVSFQATGQNLVITNMSARCSTTTNEAVGTVYKGQIGQPYRLSGTFAASSGDSNADNIPMMDGDTIYFTFAGGDAGATGYVTISGTADIGSGGFRAMG